MNLDKLLAKVKVNKVKNHELGSFLEVGELGKVLQKMKNNKFLDIDVISSDFLEGN